MSWRKNPNPTIKPPFGSYIDWSHPLADGLLYCCLLNEFTGRPSSMVDCSIAAENTMTWSGESLEGADSQYCIIKKNERINSVSEYTIISDGEFYDTTDGALFCHTASNSIYRPAIGIIRLYDNNSISLSCCSDTDSDIRIDISSSLSGHYAGRRSAVTIDAYFNGGFVDSVASDGGTLLLDNTCVAFGGIGQNTSISNRFLTGKVKYGLLWGRLLTPDEIAWQYEEPYAFISWPSRKVIFDFGSANTINLLADVQAVSNTSGILQVISRSLLANIALQSSTSGIAATLLRALLAQIAAATGTSAPSASMSRALTADIPAASSSSDPAAEIARQLVADIQAVSNTSDITAVLSGVVSLIASISGVSNTTDADTAIARTLLADIAATSDTSDITAYLQKIISLIASIGNASNTNDAGVSIARDLFAVINVETVLADALASVSRSLLSDIAVTSDTSDIIASLQNIVSLAAAITGVSLTSDITADMARSLSAMVASQSGTDNIMASVAMSLLADIAGTSVTPDDLILVLSGLGLIIDPEIESLTPARTLESVTTKRIIEST